VPQLLWLLGVFGSNYKPIIGGKQQKPCQTVCVSLDSENHGVLSNREIGYARRFLKRESLPCPRHPCSLSRLLRRRACSAPGSAAPLLPRLAGKLYSSPVSPASSAAAPPTRSSCLWYPVLRRPQYAVLRRCLLLLSPASFRAPRLRHIHHLEM
jgi:hypothetical protein